MSADKQSFAELVAAHEGFGRAEALEQLQNLTVLEGVIVRDGRADGNGLNGLIIHNAIAVKMLGLAVEDGQHRSAWSHDFVEAIGNFREQLRFKVIKNVPEQNSVERFFGILQRMLEKSRGNLVGRKRLVEIALLFNALLFFFRGAEIFPGAHEIIGGDPEAALDKEIQRGLGNRAEVQQASIFHITQKPQKILQAVGSADVLRTVARRSGNGGCNWGSL